MKYYQGYKIVAAAFVIQALCYGIQFTYGIFFDEFQATFGWSRAVISGAWSLAFFVMGPVGILAGRLNDKIGPRAILVATSICLGSGHMLMSGLEKPWQLYVLYGGLVSMGFGAHDVITLSTVARWFQNRRGMLSGVIKVGTGAGQLLIPMLAIVLIAAYGWRRSYLIIGAGALVIMVIVGQFLRRDPEAMGLTRHNRRSDLSDVEFRRVVSFSARKAMVTRQLWALCVGEFTAVMCLLTIVVHVVPYSSDLGFSRAVGAGVVSIIGGVSMLGRFTLGTVIDRVGGKPTLILCFILLLSGLVWLQVASEVWMLFLFGAIYGFSHGGFFTIMSPTVAEYFGTDSHGILYGIVLSFGTLGGSIGPLMAGFVFDVTGSYRIVFLVLTGAAVVGLIIIALLRPLLGTRR